ncbi:hypothetical protein OU787_04645 [Kitasatospora sp. YST-16]|uniref:hypothetical protein n=1 Tax=Kitasatospora sp. YST-16 TaxID=2998080 RepID=UPI0022843CF3|nr:hypothetical protein [Kitasatospora sp. YST-16]WAL70847.1 hypothetical protein OU787_04645 [Kitasatospora sp. YST-16]WNW36882.1 hypothetical protein RKE32_04615 [Streptomyces sp. Li-HN-5-13]
MTDLATAAHLLTGDGLPVELLACHPRLPLAAGISTDEEADRSRVRIWDCSGGRLRELASFEVAVFTSGWGDHWLPPIAWHPHEPLLTVVDEGLLRRWTPDGRAEPLPAPENCEALAHSPDGRALWVSAIDGDDASAVLDPATGAASPARWWDTGVGVHPSGELVATLVSDQGATFCVFARPDGEGGAMRQQRRALVLDVDGYGTPLFSPDGRYLALRGNAYLETLDVFAFPSLRKVLHTDLARDEEWPRQNLAFGPQPGVLWIGTPGGTLVELDLEAREAVEQGNPDGAAVTALTSTAAGELLVAREDGSLTLLTAPTGGEPPAPAATAAADAAAFLAGTGDVPADGDLDHHLDFTDGEQDWDREKLAEVTDSSPGDPTWLQLQAHINRFSPQHTD